MTAFSHFFRTGARSGAGFGPCSAQLHVAPGAQASDGNGSHSHHHHHHHLSSAATSRASSSPEMQPLALPPDAQGSPAEDKSFVEVVCPRTVVFRGIGQDVEPVRLSGIVVLHLAEPAALRDITLEFSGKAKLPAPPSPHIKSQHGYTVYTHEQSFMPIADKKQSHTFKAGRHTFPFDVDLEPYLPSSLCVSRANITYRLRATAVRPPLSPNFTCTVPIDVVRSFGPNSLEYQQTLEVENTWPGKLMYSLTLPHKAWAAGDTVMALVKFQPLAKGVSVSVVCSMVTETVRYAGLPSIEMKKDVCSARHMFLPSANSRRTSVAGSHSSSNQHSSRAVPTGSSSGEQSSSHHQSETIANGASVDLSGFVDQEGDEEIMGKVELKIPRWVCPSHSVAPINVVHRIRWVIVIRNPDGHFSELRCSLPIHILSQHVLEEAVQASAPTRRLLFGIDDLVLPDSEQVELPTYDAHVMDPVPNATDGWPIDVGPFTTGTAVPATTSPDGYFAIAPAVRSASNPSTPGHHGRSLPEDSDFLPPSQATIGVLAAAALNSTPISMPPTQSSSASNSRPSSRPGTRPSTPEPVSSAPSSSSQTLEHPPLPAPVPSRKPLFSLGGMKPLTAFSSRAPSGSRASSRPTTPPHHTAASFDRALQAALSAVPDYDTASRGFALGGVPPLSSTAGLPSYDEASRSVSDGDLASRARLPARHVSFADPDGPAHAQPGVHSRGSAPASSQSSDYER